MFFCIIFVPLQTNQAFFIKQLNNQLTEQWMDRILKPKGTVGEFRTFKQNKNYLSQSSSLKIFFYYHTDRMAIAGNNFNWYEIANCRMTRQYPQIHTSLVHKTIAFSVCFV